MSLLITRHTLQPLDKVCFRSFEIFWDEHVLLYFTTRRKKKKTKKKQDISRLNFADVFYPNMGEVSGKHEEFISEYWYIPLYSVNTLKRGIWTEHSHGAATIWDNCNTKYPSNQLTTNRKWHRFIARPFKLLDKYPTTAELTTNGFVIWYRELWRSGFTLVFLWLRWFRYPGRKGKFFQTHLVHRIAAYTPKEKENYSHFEICYEQTRCGYWAKSYLLTRKTLRTLENAV